MSRNAPAPATSPATLRPSLDRRLGPLDAAAIVVSNVIGGGIFFVPIIVAQMVPHAAAILWVWLIGGALAFAGAMAYAELSALRPRAGGEYVYLREAFGPLAAFLTGWTSFVAGFTGAIAASAVAVADYVGRFVPAAADATPFVTMPIPVRFRSFSRRKSIVALVPDRRAFVHSHPRSRARTTRAERARRAEGDGAGRDHRARIHDRVRRTAVRLAAAAAVSRCPGMLLALVPIMFTYSGWNAAVYVAEEVRNPGRNVPLALGLGTAAVIVIYVALNALYLHVLRCRRARVRCRGGCSMSSANACSASAANAIAVFTIVSLSASISAMTLAGPRVYYAMAQDGLFLPAAARVHPRFHTPAAAIVAQGLWSAVLVLCGIAVAAGELYGFRRRPLLGRRRGLAVRAAAARTRTRRARSARGVIPGRPRSSSSRARDGRQRDHAQRRHRARRRRCHRRRRAGVLSIQTRTLR